MNISEILASYKTWDFFLGKYKYIFLTLRHHFTCLQFCVFNIQLRTVLWLKKIFIKKVDNMERLTPFQIAFLCIFKPKIGSSYFGVLKPLLYMYILYIFIYCTVYILHILVSRNVCESWYFFARTWPKIFLYNLK